MRDHRIITASFLLICVFWLLPTALTLNAADWPTWRHDTGRSAATNEQLPSDLSLQWRRALPPLKPAWPEDPRLHFDAVYQPVVLGQQMFVASSVNDSVTAYDTTSGEQRWRFYAEGPVRFAPVAWEGKLYFGADDGCMYCLNAKSGNLLWKFRAAPNARKAIGNDRLISVWPVRGGPVLEQGKVYFTVGVWPFEGTFLYALDANTGTPVSATEGGDTNAVVLKDRTPQGYLAISDSQLFIPCGRAVVVCLDRDTGSFQKFGYRTSTVTNYHVAVQDNWLFHGVVNYDTKSKATLPIQASEPVLTPDTMFAATGGSLTAHDLKNPQTVTVKDRRGKTSTKLVLQQRWTTSPQDLFGTLPANLKTHPLKVHIKAGSRLYAHQDSQILAIDLPGDNAKAGVSWQSKVEGTPASMLAADGKLFVVTEQGEIYCFGKDRIEPKIHSLPSTRAVAKSDVWNEQAKRLLDHTGAKDGYCLVAGIGTGRLIEELAATSNLQIIGVDLNQDKVTDLRRRLDARGLYGTRVSLLTGPLSELSLPPYFASLITSEEPQEVTSDLVKSLFSALRPYGGVAILETADGEHDKLVKVVAENKLPQAEVNRLGRLSSLARVGALPGSADWTHEYGDPSNSLMSRDQLVKAPLGVLWFGGPAAHGDLFYNRHYWGPSMAVIDGRMFIQGPEKLTAVDVYTGRVLWMTPLKHPENYNPGRRGNNFENKLMGFHFLAVRDSLYLVMGKECLRIDPVTGKELTRFKLPKSDDQWGRIRVQGDTLLATAFREDEKLGSLPKELVAMNRHTGKVLWTKEANLTFPFVAIGGNRVFCFDGAIENLYRDWTRKGLLPKAADIRELKALDLETGKQVWNASTDMVVTWLSYSAEHDVLITSNRSGIAGRTGKNGKELWQKTAEGKGFRGHPESYWDKVILWNDRVIDQRGPGLAYDIRTGKPTQRANPITGKSIDWEFTKSGHHCNYAIANPHMLTFRAASAGFCDIESTNTARLEGYRSGCRNSLIPANGVLNSPNFAHGCVCGYSLFTSLALTHLPENEMWSYSALKTDNSAVQRLGINFGAPGDRTSSDGVLWLDYPNVGGSSPTVAVKVTGDKTRVFQQHSAFLSSGDMRWVAASGMEDVSSISIPLANSKPRDYVVRLHFAEPTAKAEGERKFDVSIEDKPVLTQFDLFKEAGGANRAVVKEFEVSVDSVLNIAFGAQVGKPLICGVEMIAR